MLVRDQVVLHTVHEESWYSNTLDAADVLEAVLDEVLQEVAGLVLDDRANRLKAGHKDDGSRLALARQVRRWPRTHATAENYHVLVVDTEHLVQVVIDVRAIIEDVLLARVKHIFIVRLIRVEPVAVASGLDLRLERRRTHGPAAYAAFVTAQVEEHRAASDTIFLTFKGRIYLFVFSLQAVRERPGILVASLMLAGIQTVARIFDRDDVHPQHGPEAVQQLVAEDDVLGVRVEVYQNFRTAAGVRQVQAWDKMADALRVVLFVEFTESWQPFLLVVHFVKIVLG